MISRGELAQPEILHFRNDDDHPGCGVQNEANRYQSSQPAMERPPFTARETVTEVLHGVQVTDDYRWLEDHTSSKTQQWLCAQGEYTRKHLSALPNRNRIRHDIYTLLATDIVSNPRKVGSRYFYQKRLSYQQQPSIVMKEGESGPESILVDPALRFGNEAIVKLMNVSSDGRVMAYGVSSRADFSRRVEFLDITTGEALADSLPSGYATQVIISPDSSGFYYSNRGIGGLDSNCRSVRWHKFGTNCDGDEEIFSAGDDPHIYIQLFASATGRYLGYIVTRTAESSAVDLYIQDVFHKTPAIKIVSEMTSSLQPTFVDEHLFALTDLDAPNQRVVRIDPARPNSKNWTEIIPESPWRIKDLCFTGNYICVNYVENACSRLEVFDNHGNWLTTVPRPPSGGVQLPWRLQDGETLFYNFSSFNHSPAIFSYHIPTRAQRVWAQQSVNIDLSAFQVSQVRYPSKDGTEILMFLVGRKGYRDCGPRPTFLTGYGGFGSVRTPKFNIYSAYLIDHGVLFAFPSLRGGGEFGENWHLAGKRRNRQNAFDDFIAAAEWLIDEGYADPGKIAIGGGSNAGLLVGVALTQRPELFRTAVCMGPLLDMVRYQQFDSAYTMADEFGTAELEEDFLNLYSYSPYHQVKEHTAYPSVLLISGGADTCCNPMHALKMTARLQRATVSGRPVLLDYQPNWGHASVQPLNRRVEALTDRLAFILHELGVTV